MHHLDQTETSECTWLQRCRSPLVRAAPVTHGAIVVVPALAMLLRGRSIPVAGGFEPCRCGQRMVESSTTWSQLSRAARNRSPMVRRRLADHVCPFTRGPPALHSGCGRSASIGRAPGRLPPRALRIAAMPASYCAICSLTVTPCTAKSHSSTAHLTRSAQTIAPSASASSTTLRNSSPPYRPEMFIARVKSREDPAKSPQPLRSRPHRPMHTSLIVR